MNKIICAIFGHKITTESSLKRGFELYEFTEEYIFYKIECERCGIYLLDNAKLTDLKGRFYCKHGFHNDDTCSKCVKEAISNHSGIFEHHKS